MGCVDATHPNAGAAAAGFGGCKHREQGCRSATNHQSLKCRCLSSARVLDGEHPSRWRGRTLATCVDELSTVVHRDGKLPARLGEFVDRLEMHP